MNSKMCECCVYICTVNFFQKDYFYPWFFYVSAETFIFFTAGFMKNYIHSVVQDDYYCVSLHLLASVEIYSLSGVSVKCECV